MKDKIVISSTNKKAIEFIKNLKEKKSQLQKHFANPANLSGHKTSFHTLPKKAK